MRHISLFEFHELSWFPRVWRNLFTEALSFFIVKKNLYAPVAALLGPRIERDQNPTVVDLCSGAGSPSVTVVRSLGSNIAAKTRVLLTDKFPNTPALIRISRESNGKVAFIDESIDATDVPEDLNGFRTIFSSFHHFNEESALAILSDAVRKRKGIGIFEFTERSLLFRLVPFFLPLQVWLWSNTPLIRPFCWHRILWTYLLPIVPLIFFWDGIVSCLRSYSEGELRELIKNVDGCEYSWETGRIRSAVPFKITYLIGIPLRKA